MPRSSRRLAIVAFFVLLTCAPGLAALRSRAFAGAKKEFRAAIKTSRNESSLTARVAAIRAFAAMRDDRVFKELFGALEPLDKAANRARAEVDERTEAVDEIWERVFKFQAQQIRAGKPGNTILVTDAQALDKATAFQQIAARDLDELVSLREAVSDAIGTFFGGLADDEREAIWESSVRLSRRSSDPAERAAFVHALGEFGGETVVATLLEFEADDDDVGVRVAALGALAKHRGDARVFPTLVERLDDPTWEIASAAIRGVSRFRNALVIPALVTRLESAEGRIFADLVETLTAITGKHVPDSGAAWKAWWDREGETFLARWGKDAAGRLSEIEKIADSDATKVDPTAELIALDLREEDPIVRVAIAEALGRLATSVARRALVHRLDEKEPRLRLAVIAALGNYRHLGVAHALVKRAGEADDAERAAIGRALKAIWGDEDAEKQPFSLEKTTRNAIEDWWIAQHEMLAARLKEVKKDDDEDAPVERELDERDRNFYGLPLYSKRILFIIDVSGSMLQGSGVGDKTKIDVAKAELTKAIRGLSDDATFGVIAFSNAASLWGNGMMTAKPALRKRALEEIEALEANGGTNVYDSLEMAFLLGVPKSPYKSSEGAPDTIYLVSDGAPSSGKFVDPEKIRKHVAILNRERAIKIHTIGIGKDHIEAFLRKLADENGGTYVRR